MVSFKLYGNLPYKLSITQCCDIIKWVYITFKINCDVFLTDFISIDINMIRLPNFQQLK